MSVRVKCKGGPLHGKSFDVPDGVESFPAVGGSYSVGAVQATWRADDAAAPADAPASTPESADG